jgi:hypothetical protein
MGLESATFIAVDLFWVIWSHCLFMFYGVVGADADEPFSKL